jgi:hypothetical protein
MASISTRSRLSAVSAARMRVLRLWSHRLDSTSMAAPNLGQWVNQKSRGWAFGQRLLQSRRAAAASQVLPAGCSELRREAIFRRRSLGLSCTCRHAQLSSRALIPCCLSRRCRRDRQSQSSVRDRTTAGTATDTVQSMRSTANRYWGRLS